MNLFGRDNRITQPSLFILSLEVANTPVLSLSYTHARTQRRKQCGHIPCRVPLRSRYQRVYSLDQAAAGT